MLVFSFLGPLGDSGKIAVHMSLMFPVPEYELDFVQTIRKKVEIKHLPVSTSFNHNVISTDTIGATYH